MTMTRLVLPLDLIGWELNASFLHAPITECNDGKTLQYRITFDIQLKFGLWRTLTYRGNNSRPQDCTENRSQIGINERTQSSSDSLKIMGEELNFNRQFKSRRSSRHIHYIDEQNDVKKIPVCFVLLVDHWCSSTPIAIYGLISLVWQPILKRQILMHYLVINLFQFCPFRHQHEQFCNKSIGGSWPLTLGHSAGPG